MPLVHEPADDRADAGGERTVLATDVEVANGLVRKALGVMFRRSLPAGYALVFPFDTVAARSIHMVGVFVALDVVWIDGQEVTAVKRLSPWRGFGRARGDLIVELPAGDAEDVRPGDAVWIEQP